MSMGDTAILQNGRSASYEEGRGWVVDPVDSDPAPLVFTTVAALTQWGAENDWYGLPKTDLCRTCGERYPLDWSAYIESRDDQLTPVRDYCPKHSSTIGSEARLG